MKKRLFFSMSSGVFWAWVVFVAVTPSVDASTIPVSLVQTQLSVSEIVSPYSMSGNLREKRRDIIELVIGAAVEELEATCSARNIRLKQDSGMQVCSSMSYCPDVSLRVMQQSRELSLEAFIESDATFKDVRFGFKVVWSFSTSSSSYSICYAPAIHPTIRDLRSTLLADPFFINRISNMSH